MKPRNSTSVQEFSQMITSQDNICPDKLVDCDKITTKDKNFKERIKIDRKKRKTQNYNKWQKDVKVIYTSETTKTPRRRKTCYQSPDRYAYQTHEFRDDIHSLNKKGYLQNVFKNNPFVYFQSSGDCRKSIFGKKSKKSKEKDLCEHFPVADMGDFCEEVRSSSYNCTHLPHFNVVEFPQEAITTCQPTADFNAYEPDIRFMAILPPPSHTYECETVSKVNNEKESKCGLKTVSIPEPKTECECEPTSITFCPKNTRESKAQTSAKLYIQREKKQKKIGVVDSCQSEQMCATSMKLKSRSTSPKKNRTERCKCHSSKVITRKFIKYIFYGFAIIIFFPCVLVYSLCWFVTYPLRPRTQNNGSTHKSQQSKCVHKTLREVISKIKCECEPAAKFCCFKNTREIKAQTSPKLCCRSEEDKKKAGVIGNSSKQTCAIPIKLTSRSTAPQKGQTERCKREPGSKSNTCKYIKYLIYGLTVKQNTQTQPSCRSCSSRLGSPREDKKIKQITSKVSCNIESKLDESSIKISPSNRKHPDPSQQYRMFYGGALRGWLMKPLNCYGVTCKRKSRTYRYVCPTVMPVKTTKKTTPKNKDKKKEKKAVKFSKDIVTSEPKTPQRPRPIRESEIKSCTDPRPYKKPCKVCCQPIRPNLDPRSVGLVRYGKEEEKKPKKTFKLLKKNDDNKDAKKKKPPSGGLSKPKKKTKKKKKKRDMKGLVQSIKDAEDEAWGNEEIKCDEIWVRTLRKRPCFWIYKLRRGLYPCFLQWHSCFVNCFSCCIMCMSTILWCPLLICVFICYKGFCR